MPEKSSKPTKSGYVYLSVTGRSGTSALGHALGRHAETVYFKEPKFMTDFCGLRFFMEGRCNLEQFSTFMTYKYTAYIKTTMDIPPETVVDLVHLAVLKSEDNKDLCRRFLVGLRQVLKAKYRDKIMIEKQPHVDELGHLLSEWFPKTRFIHIFRDPRDVFASVRAQYWGPDTLDHYLKWYQKRIESSLAAHQSIAGDQLAVVSLKTLVTEPHHTLKRLFEFLNLRSEAGDVERSAQVIGTPEKANLGRWRNDLEPNEARAIAKHCMPLHDRLRQSEEAWMRRPGIAA